MAARVNRVIHFQHCPVLIEKVADAFGIARFGIGTRAVGKPDRPAGVTEEREREIEFLSERRIVRDGIKTHP